MPLFCAFWQLCVLLSLPQQAGGAYVAEQTLRQHHNGPGGPDTSTFPTESTIVTKISNEAPTN